MQQPINNLIQDLLTEKLRALETHFQADFFVYYGSIINGHENKILSIIENIDTFLFRRQMIQE
jgi:hypothetical protein